MDCADLRRVGESYVESTRAAARVGFDLLEIDMAHGYLLHSFLSPVANRRNDEFGGSFENRTRFPLQVLRAVRAAWPDERPLAVRLAATDWIKGGMTEDEAVAFGALCKEAGCDLIHVVSGQASAHSSPTFGRAWQAALSDLMRNEALIPTMCGGNITSADEINTILAAGRADLCVLAPWLPPSPPALLWRGAKR
jgi:anthraniloyl-CoA monooxygenase